MPRDSKPKPRLRVLRHLARSGGTLISKCIATMDGVALLSEVHPKGMKLTKPLLQAEQWYGLVTQQDTKNWKLRGEPDFAQLMTILQQRAAAKGMTLVIRDWSHLDFIGRPFCEPGGGFAIGEALSDRYEVLAAYTTRHPLDQFVSLMSLPIMQGAVTLAQYASGCRAFGEVCAREGFVRYEDFTNDPDGSLRAICERLELAFDSGYASRWQDYTNISGEIQGGRGGRREIKPVERRPIDAKLIEAFRANADYVSACEMLGYDP